MSATKAAVAEGIIAGGGSALVHAAAELADLGLATGDEATGVAIVREALTAPPFWIAANGGARGRRRRQQGRRAAAGAGLRRRHRRVRRPGQGRHHRPGQGDPVGGRQRRVDRRHGADHGELGGREAGGGERGGPRPRSLSPLLRPSIRSPSATEGDDSERGGAPLECRPVSCVARPLRPVRRATLRPRVGRSRGGSISVRSA